MMTLRLSCDQAVREITKSNPVVRSRLRRVIIFIFVEVSPWKSTEKLYLLSFREAQATMNPQFSQVLELQIPRSAREDNEGLVSFHDRGPWTWFRKKPSAV